jgi:outer membrane protein OmpA-like peptidoglycan-associated protein
MKGLTTIVMVFLLCLFANPLLGGDCSEVSKQIGNNKNNPKELRKLLEVNPQCGEVWEALGDYFYEKKVWNESYTNYEEAKKYLPDSKKLSSRLQELRPKVTALIKDEQELLAYRRSIGGTAPSLPDSPQKVAPPLAPSPGGEKASATSSHPPQAGSGKKVERSMQIAGKSSSSSQETSAQGRAKAEKVGLVILFEYKSAEITPESGKLLAGFAEVLNTELAGRNFFIDGHTDNIGPHDYNLLLSKDRAKSVKSYLVVNGVDANRLEVRGYGFDKPIFDNDTESGRSKNRRVEFEEK